MIVNKQNLSTLYVAIKTAFNKGLKSNEVLWSRVATEVPSSTKEESYKWLGQFPRLQKWIGDRVIKNLKAHSYSITNEKFESTVGIPKDDIEDDTYGVFTPLFEEMGYSALTHPDELVFGLLAKGFDELCYDGQNFFDTDHKVGEDSVSNMQAGSGVPWFLLDTNRPLKPIIFQKRRDYSIKARQDDTSEAVWQRDEFEYGVDARVNAGFGLWQLAFGSKADLTAANFDTAMESMMGLKSDEGRPLGVRPNLLVVGPKNRAKANQVIEVMNQEGGASNPNYKAVEVLVVSWLD
ncbi:phage major head subunit gpT-like protein [Idiomarina loihiensis]|uniref:Mu-like prophage major head subunit gpT family protein n=1 Tax=Idiomarina TaxID=135575 RepID=UPI000D709CAD|nr:MULTISPECIES: Mu-like prophage major head subunit gpT family protein [Idiomarina]PWW41622.1 phage major head subunit gpT-like protein [Idiomarina loihiensis]TDP50680.1 phage major head subunit gpT-like protein [Idiomarina loihiensis]TDS25042.1 phage major head subunit gpT-like protein [Idiomarina sp. H2]